MYPPNSPYIAYFTDFFWEGAHLGLDIVAEPERYRFRFWDRTDREGSKMLARAALEKMNCLDEFTFAEGSFWKTLEFPAEEAELFEQIRMLKKRCSGLVVQPTA